MIKKTILGLGLIIGLFAACGGPEATETEATDELRRGSSGQGAQCGGFAALLCPKGLVCIDDPSDSCDPNNNGADCSGICEPAHCADNYADPSKDFKFLNPSDCARVHFICPATQEYFADRGCGCGCKDK